MKILRIIQKIWRHPLNQKQPWRAFFRFFKWQISSRLTPYPIIFPFGQQSEMVMERGVTGATGNYYCGLFEFEDMAFVLHFLRPEDHLIDIGANIGSYTLLGSREVGCKTTAFEPIPLTHQRLLANVRLNDISDKVRVLHMGVGKEKGRLHFTTDLDSRNHVAITDEQNVLEVPVVPFDEVIQISDTTLIKIDVEGFENAVLDGMPIALTNPSLKVIIMELNGSGLRYGFNDRDIHKRILSLGFKPFRYEPFSRRLTELESFGVHNTIYVRDLQFITARIEGAPKVTIHNRTF